MASTLRLRRDKEEDWASSAATARLKAGEPGLFHDDATGDFLGRLKIGKMVSNDDASTLASDLALWHLLSDDEKAKLAELSIVTGELVVSLINDFLDVDLATALHDGGWTYNALATILDSGPTGTRWRNAAVSLYGSPADEDGDLTLANNAAPMAAIDGLTAALAGKSEDGHGHTTSQITGLELALAAKVANTLLGVASGVATLGEDGKLTASQVPTSVGNVVTSVHGRTGAVVAVAGDYSPNLINIASHGFVSAGNLQAFLDELIDEVIPLSQKGANSGVVPLNSSGKIDSGYLQTADSAFVASTTMLWQTSTSTPSLTLTPIELSNQNKRFIVDLTNASKIRFQCFLQAATLGSTGTKTYLEYATAADSYGTWAAFGDNLMLDGTAGTGFIYTAEADIPAGAKTATTIIRMMMVGGTASTSAGFGQTVGIIKYYIPINTGSMNGSQIVSVLDAYLSGTGWRDPIGSIPDGSVTLAKLANIASGTVLARTAAGTGVPQAVTKADFVTFLDLVNTVHGRKGAVVAASGDYNTDQVTETATNVYVTPTQKQAIARMIAPPTVFTTSSIVGFNEAFVVFGGTGTTALTATLTNGAVAGFINIFNDRTVAINLVPQTSRTMRKADGTVLTTYSLASKAGLCAILVGTAWVLQV